MGRSVSYFLKLSFFCICVFSCIEVFSATYSYDTNGRLVSVATNSTMTSTFEYDASGNLIRKTVVRPGPYPVATASPNPLNFGSVTMGSPTTQPITVTNLGPGNLIVGQVNVSGAAFSIASNTCTTVTPTNNCAITVQFAPLVTGTATGSVTISSNATASPQSVTLNGTGTAATDATAPTVPTTLTAGSPTTSTAALNWGASTDSGGSGLAGYKLERCAGSGCSDFVQIATPSSNAFGDTGLVASTIYSYRVRAYDNAGNMSGYSNVATITTLGAAINGSCGSANLGTFAIAPSGAALCNAGNATIVTGIGPWTWTCQGINGGTNASCSAQLGDTTPDAFAFVTQTGVPLNSAMTSNTVTITGINAPAPISVSGGTYSIGCTATFVATASTISNNQTVCVRHTSASSNATTVTTTLDVGGVQATFQSVTQAAAGVPNAFAFAPKTNVPVNTMVSFNPVTITGLTAPATVTVWGGGEYSVGCTGLFTTAEGTITNNQAICVRHLSAATNDTNKSSVLSVGGVRAAFSSVTIGAMIGACTVQPSPGKDTYYGNVYLTTGMPTAEWIHAGGWGDSYRSYVQIDVSSLPAAVDTTTAELQLYVTNASIADPLLRIYRIDSDWTDVGVTIASQPSVTYLAEAPRGATAGNWYHLDITALYKDWKNGTRPNFGVMLEPGYTENSAYTFASSEAPTAAQRPKIVVQSASGACGAPAMTCDMNISGRGGATDQVDGVLLMRYLLGFRGTALTAGLTLTGWRKTHAEIEQFLSLFNYDIDGSGKSDATVDGMILLRLLRGASDAALLSGVALPPSAAVRDATTMRARATACWASMMN